MLANCLRRWANISPTLDQHLAFDGMTIPALNHPCQCYINIGPNLDFGFDKLRGRWSITLSDPGPTLYARIWRQKTSDSDV